jgi:Rrf2 family protein
MKLSRKGEYALRAMVVLADRYGEGLVQIQEIADREHLPKKFLEQILRDLSKAGLVEGRRGRGGGYRMIKPPERITMATVIRTIDGPLAPLGCVSQLAHVECPERERCGLREVMQEVRNAIARVLENVSLADICARSRALAHAGDRCEKEGVAVFLASKPTKSMGKED